MSKHYDELQAMHPCFAQKKKGSNGRIHLPVSPGCNIRCAFCVQRIGDGATQAPAAASEVITPDEALDVVARSLELCPDITVVGIAGPGDTLASDNALNTFRLVGEHFPQLLKCMSTNGLLLLDRAQEIIDVGIDSLTVTVNAVDPSIEARLCESVFYHGVRYAGVQAAKLLIDNQLEGIRKVSSAGTTVKVNTVLVPGINDGHIEQIAQTVAEAGAKIYNIIPLIPQGKLACLDAPNCMQVDKARCVAEPYIDVFRHCQHCRADAIGIPGESDFGEQIYLKRVAVQDTFSHG